MTRSTGAAALLLDQRASASPEAAGLALTTALATVLCTERHAQRPACAECAAVATVLAPPVGRVLFYVANRGQPARQLTDADYVVLGRALDWLEERAGLRRPVRTLDKWPQP